MVGPYRVSVKVSVPFVAGVVVDRWVKFMVLEKWETAGDGSEGSRKKERERGERHWVEKG